MTVDEKDAVNGCRLRIGQVNGTASVLAAYAVTIREDDMVAALEGIAATLEEVGERMAAITEHRS